MGGSRRVILRGGGGTQLLHAASDMCGQVWSVCGGRANCGNCLIPSLVLCISEPGLEDRSKYKFVNKANLHLVVPLLPTTFVPRSHDNHLM